MSSTVDPYDITPDKYERGLYITWWFSDDKGFVFKFSDNEQLRLTFANDFILNGKKIGSMKGAVDALDSNHETLRGVVLNDILNLYSNVRYR